MVDWERRRVWPSDWEWERARWRGRKGRRGWGWE